MYNLFVASITNWKYLSKWPKSSTPPVRNIQNVS